MKSLCRSHHSWQQPSSHKGLGRLGTVLSCKISRTNPPAATVASSFPWVLYPQWSPPSRLIAPSKTLPERVSAGPRSSAGVRRASAAICKLQVVVGCSLSYGSKRPNTVTRIFPRLAGESRPTSPRMSDAFAVEQPAGPRKAEPLKGAPCEVSVGKFYSGGIGIRVACDLTENPVVASHAGESNSRTESGSREVRKRECDKNYRPG